MGLIVQHPGASIHHIDMIDSENTSIVERMKLICVPAILVGQDHDVAM